jgi:hypothetical protein
LLLTATIISCVAAPPPEVKERSDIQALKDPESPQQLSSAYSSVFAGVTCSEIDGLVEAVHDEIALGAGWLRLSRCSATNDAEQGTDRKAKLERFMGLVEGRLRITPPAWWEQSVSSFFDRDIINKAHVSLEKEDRRMAEAGLWVPRKTSFKRSENNVRVHRGENACELPKQIADAVSGIWIDSLQIKFTKEQYYVVLFGPYPRPATIYCVKREGNKLRWKELIWLGKPIIGGSGTTAHWLELYPIRDKVYVFGIWGDEAYIEAFQATDGKDVLRFSTHYADID